MVISIGKARMLGRINYRWKDWVLSRVTKIHQESDTKGGKGHIRMS